MKISHFTFSVMLGILLLTGCDNPKSIQWYKEHPQEMNQHYISCESSGDDNQDCKNARQARFEQRQGNAKIPDLN
ncbi:EexN family lipoprotein [Kosakonia sp. YIM B13611]|uniref:EexN family lipoprotein n=1 Tax=unclassified Kosakonia TaxID=2632876 RepID=UPI0036B5B01F